MRRVLCVRLPHWPLQRLQREQPGLEGCPVVLYREAGRSGLQVTCCSPAAARKGVMPGMPLAEARALLAGTDDRLHAERHDPRADRAALEELAAWCQRFSPLVGIADPDCLLLDATGVAPLFGGERGLVDEIVRSFDERGYRAHVALADTLGAAWAMAQSRLAARGTVVLRPGRQAQALSPLPVEALRLPEAVVQRLHRLDLRRIGQLERLPRATLPSRFGRVLLERLDQATGRLSEPLVPFHATEIIEVEWPFEHPTADRRVLEAACRELLTRLVAKLRREGVQQLWCLLETVEPVSFRLELVQPRASVPHLLELIGLRLERLALPGEVSRIRLRATRTGPLECRQRELFESGRGSERRRQLRLLLDRLSSRLGEASVLRPRLCPDHQPEHAVRFDPVVEAERGDRETERQRDRGTRRKRSQLPFHRSVSPSLRPSVSLSRPLRLRPKPVAVHVWSVVPDGPPVRFEWAGRSHRIGRCWGPERIETGWWRSRDVRRDYYRIETEDGRRFWLFRRVPEGDWFLHGSFE